MTVSTPAADTVTGDQLVIELERLGLRYLSRSSSAETSAPLAPEVLIAGLAASAEARLQTALVPLFLWRPEYAAAVLATSERLTGKAYVMLLCCYSAAVALQQRYAERLAYLGRSVAPLPDLFASALDLPPIGDSHTRLAIVAKRHAHLSGEAINWPGTYEHAAAAFLRFAEPMPA